MKHPRVLFLLKYRNDSAGQAGIKSSGLLNSARFIHELLEQYGFDTTIREVWDGNDIDAAVSKVRPKIVILEALWVTPAKIEELRTHHPDIIWVVRIHSEIPFISNEGVALDWIAQYVQINNTYVALNSKDTHDDFHRYVTARFGHGITKKLLYLPNYYPVENRKVPFRLDEKDTIDVGCFGAIRPMKNQLIQAHAAIEFARKHGLKLRFHVNATRQDDDSMLPVLKNLRALFDGMPVQYKLVEHEWLTREDFLETVQTMDIGLQVSFSETFNIVTADFVSESVPVVVSDEIDWVPRLFRAKATNLDSIVAAMERAITFERWFDWTDWPRHALEKLVERNAHVWITTLPKIVFY